MLLTFVFSVAVLLGFGHAANSTLPVQYYTLQYEENFSGSAVNESAWNYRLDQKGNSAQLKSNVGVENGSMVITLAHELSGSYNYTGGGLVSKKNFHYGYYEARMKLNSGPGWHNSFWIQAGNGSSTFNQSTDIWTELDVFEWESVYPTMIRHGRIEWDKGNNHYTFSTGFRNTTKDFRDWHVYGLLWTEEVVVWYIDGLPAAATAYGPSDWQHDYLNIWLTSIAYNGQPDPAELPAYTLTDYVRYYQKDYYVTAGSLCRLKLQDTPCPSNQGYSETSGTWSTSALAGYTRDLTTRYVCSTPGARAQWTTTVAADGWYQISTYIQGATRSDPSATYNMYIAGEAIQPAVVVNQYNNYNSWQILKEEVFISAGQSVKVEVISSGQACTRADTVKLVRLS